MFNDGPKEAGKMKLFFVGEAAKELECSTPTVRNLEKRGLLIPIRDWSGYRRYKAEDVENLKRDLLAGKLNPNQNSPTEAHD